MSQNPLFMPVTKLSGVGKARAAELAKLGILTLGELIYYFPRAYERRGDIRLLRDGEADTELSYILTVGTRISSVQIRRGMTLSKCRAYDESGSCELVFFNAPYVKDIFHVGTEFRFYGRLTFQKGHASLINPKYEAIIPGVPLPELFPVYSLTGGLSSKILSKLMEAAIHEVLPTLCDPLPEPLRYRHKLPTLSEAIKNAHLPQNEQALSGALKRLAYDELFYFALGVASSKEGRKSGVGVTIPPCNIRPFLRLLPYELTPSQKQSVNEIYADITRKNEAGITPPMARILIGDVGTGKTVCAALAAYITVCGGFQAALMAPTEILARQHYEELSHMFSTLGFSVELLLGATAQKEKKRIREAAAQGRASLLIGTHALLSDALEFQNLGLIITDEQHRFGVAQRAALKKKASAAHLLVMSATPIPRTLALAMYGDLDVSRLTDVPAGRQRVDTFVVDEGYRQRLLAFIKKQADEGGQCYVVCPAIEPKEEDSAAVFYPDDIQGTLVQEPTEELKHAVEYAKELEQRLPDLRIGCLHGKMRSSQKEQIMEDFASGALQVLVSTTVIEVGINVPNANLMIVENAERFGLSQLHQLRGRVGRGQRKSYCILVSSHKGEAAKQRLTVCAKTNDGFRIAEEDLRLRGPGDFFGPAEDSLRQSGGFTFRFAKLCRDEALLTAAFADAKDLIHKDPELKAEEHALLRARLEQLVQTNISTIS